MMSNASTIQPMKIVLARVDMRPPSYAHGAKSLHRRVDRVAGQTHVTRVSQPQIRSFGARRTASIEPLRSVAPGLHKMIRGLSWGIAMFATEKISHAHVGHRTYALATREQYLLIRDRNQPAAIIAAVTIPRLHFQKIPNHKAFSSRIPEELRALPPFHTPCSDDAAPVSAIRV